MLSKEAKRRNRIIYALLINLGVISITLMMSLFTCSVAWFSHNKDVKTNGINIQAKVDSSIMDLSFDLYKYDFDQKSGIKLTEGEASRGDNLSLNKYDNFILERNKNNNNIIRFEIKFGGTVGSDRELNLKLKCLDTTKGTTFDNQISADSSNRTYFDTFGYEYIKDNNEDLKFVCNNISNVIEFKYFAYSYTLNGETLNFKPDMTKIDENNPANTYATATEIFTGMPSLYFVNGTSKSTTINIKVNDIDGGTESMVLYLQYNYSKSLIDGFLNPNEMINTNTDLEVLKTNETISFIKDIESISFSTGEEAISNE